MPLADAASIMFMADVHDWFSAGEVIFLAKVEGNELSLFPPKQQQNPFPGGDRGHAPALWEAAHDFKCRLCSEEAEA